MPTIPSAEEITAPDDDGEQEEVEEAPVDTRRHPGRNKRLFRDRDNNPVGFFLHGSIKKEDQIRKLTDDIKKHGGRIVDEVHRADTVLIHRSRNQGLMQLDYHGARDARLHNVYVEYTTFIQHCIRGHHFAHRPPTQTRMGGRPPGRSRIEFTEKDDDNLCHFLANIMPYKASGGRQGLNVYKRLVELSKISPERYAWAARHTPESWKERYKKKAALLDRVILDIVAKNPPSKKQLWPEDRRAPHSKKRRDYVELDSDGEEIEQSQSEEEEEGGEEEEEEGEEEEEEEDEGGEERNTDDDVDYMASRKRRRSERMSHQSEPAAKRARVSQHRRPQESPISSNKGKERAEEEEEPEDEPHGTSLFSEEGDENMYDTMPNEPGPSGHFHSPERTLVASIPTHPNRPITPTFFSQQTVLNTAPPGHVSNAANRGSDNVHVSKRSGQVLPPSSPPPALPSLNPPRQHRSSQNVIAPSDPAQNTLQHIFASPRKQSQRSANITQSTPPQPPPAQPSVSSNQRPRKGARRPPVVAAQPALEDPAPYRNTRSRSRSVQPPVLPSVTRPRKQKNQKEIIPEVIEATDAEGPDDNIPVAQEPLPPIREAIVEEIVVEKLLIPAERPSPNVREVSRNPRLRQVSMETDDAQTAHSLRARSTASKIGPAKGFSSLRVPPSEMLNSFDDDDSFGSRYSYPLNTRPLNRPSSVVPAELSEVRQNDPPRPQRKSGPFNFKTADPHTPAKRPRIGSNSSSDSFPAAGTRASALKKDLLQLGKQAVYTPPEGTRAAAMPR